MIFSAVTIFCADYIMYIHESRREVSLLIYDSELNFICSTLTRAHIHTSIVPPGEPFRSILAPELETLFGDIYPCDQPLHKVIGETEPKTLYRITDVLGLSYMYLSLPDSPKSEFFIIGPYSRSAPSSRRIMEIAESNGIEPKNQRYLEEYYSSIPVLPESSHLFTMLDTFCELIWMTPSFSVVDKDREWQTPASPINETTRNESFDDVLINMVALEKRYSFENELMRSVELGQIRSDIMSHYNFSDQVFERRSADPLRNIKNYMIIMNTLLRKAAQSGGVHPVYLDRVSSSFALRIEQLPAVEDATGLMDEMHRSYCRLVRKHSLNDYSPPVQKAIILIDSDLSANLTLSTLADSQNISPGYLSTIFKKETGCTVSEYIRDKRIKHAAHLLTTTHLQIQTIALHCGIMDVQYFSKIFKKQTGKTPNEYRETARQG